ncbi:MAG TPA: glucose 1-dehydrogenase [Candidatus Marinimicrobia bacterium]|jgi:3-oxoacyl-[acyl-carrier protein] reductase|nr:glucose 1-dehydrogenase [Candidatus Neomarinimicrobiota bacterium]HIN26445.1 glucose 1-dehydrogenase [Candidatus Neomarinimicrobiota bacterium]
MNLLENKVCIVTGGGRGIGQATAEKFIGESATVIIADFDEATGTATAEYLGDQCSFVKTDVSQSESVKSLIKRVKADHGSIDVIVNNAGILQDQTLEKMDEEEFDKVIQVNMRGVYLCTKYAAEVMREQGSGVILNASSVVARFGNFGQTNYVAAKAGLEGMTKVWARELGKHGIRVNAVAPGFIQTDMIAGMPEKIIKMMGAKVPLKRWGQPEDVANLYCFLASDEASYISGVVLPVDGGVVV